MSIKTMGFNSWNQRFRIPLFPNSMNKPAIQKKEKKRKKRNRNFLIIGFISISFGLFATFWYSRTSLKSQDEIFYDFENEEIGSFPSGWRGTRWDGTEIVRWREESEGFGKVAEIMNRDGDGVEFANRFNDAKVGIIEFDIYGDTTKHFVVHICQTDAEYNPIDDIIIRFRDSGITTKDRGVYKKVLGYIINKWYHFRIAFDVDDDWHLWIDGVNIDNNFGYEYLQKPPYFAQLYFWSFELNNRFFVDNVKITVKE